MDLILKQETKANGNLDYMPWKLSSSVFLEIKPLLILSILYHI